MSADFVFGIEYAPPKFGKSSNALRSFPMATFLAEEKAVRPLEHEVGWAPQDIRPVSTVSEATKILQEVAKRRKNPKEFIAAVVDDLTLIAENSVAGKTGDKFAIYGALKNEIIVFRNTAAKLGIHVWCNAHIQPPKTENGFTFLGGPKLPGNNSQSIASMVETIVKTEVHPQKTKGWPMVYRCSPQDKNYYTGDRWGMIYDQAPQNIAELMRSRGFDVPRAPGLEWQEEYIEAIAGELLAQNAKTRLIAKKKLFDETWTALEADGVDPRHIYWMLKDTDDRVAIRTHLQNKFRNMLG